MTKPIIDITLSPCSDNNRTGVIVKSDGVELAWEFDVIYEDNSAWAICKLLGKMDTLGLITVNPDERVKAEYPTCFPH